MPTDQERQDYLLSPVPHIPGESMADWMRREAERGPKEDWENVMERQLWVGSIAREFHKKFPAEDFRKDGTYQEATNWLKKKTKVRREAKDVLDAAGVTDEAQTTILTPWDKPEEPKAEKPKEDSGQPSTLMSKSEVVQEIVVNAQLMWKGEPRIVRAVDEDAVLISAADGSKSELVAKSLVEAATVYDNKSYRKQQEEEGKGEFEKEHLISEKKGELLKTAKGVEVPYETLVDWLFDQATDVQSLVEPTSVQRYLEAWGLKFADKDILTIVTIVLQRQKQLDKMKGLQEPAAVPVEPSLDEPMEEEPGLAPSDEDREPAETPTSLTGPGQADALSKEMI